MVTPPKGDYASIPINAGREEGRRRLGPGEGRSGGRAVQGLRRAGADARAGAAAHHVAGRQHAEGRDRRRHADAAASTSATGSRPAASRRCRATRPRSGRPRARPRRPAAAAAAAALRQPQDRDDPLRPGYLRKNGVPYSDKTTLTEYWDLLRQPNGDQWIVITTVVEDPTYLDAHVDHEPQFQEGAERLQVGPIAVLGEVSTHANARTRGLRSPCLCVGCSASRRRRARARAASQAAQAALQGTHDRLLRHVGEPPARGLGRARARAAHRRLHRAADQRRGARRGRRLPGVDAEHARAAVHPLHLAVHRHGPAEPAHRAGARSDLGRRASRCT